eukprot:TRINITY_DN14137_c0_g3_i1.p1 TRINITY_DN14137_c0_g3~~TRINITY_DN14137_c0_g3_i1.p1  ORF type:complete len:1072 (+),score=205.75 TRINITY_DN14137_c0_g3_i1:103-3318(+)
MPSWQVQPKQGKDIRCPPIKEEPKIIWQDTHVAILAKGAGWIVAISRDMEQNKVYDKLLRDSGITDCSELVTSGKCEHLCHYIALRFKEDKSFKLSNDLRYEWGIAHRLDVDTSGALMIGKTAEGFHYLRESFKQHEVFKEYICLVHGSLEHNQGEINYPIYWDEGSNTSYIHPRGDWAKTYYYVTARYRLKGESKIFSLCRVVIVTGRTHQIRLHMASIGHPLVSDSKYNYRNYKTDSMWCPRLFLHAWRLGFHTFEYEWQEVRTSLAPDLARSLRTLDEIKLDAKRPDAPSCRMVQKEAPEHISSTLNGVPPVYQTGKLSMKLAKPPSSCPQLKSLNKNKLQLPKVVLPKLGPPPVELPPVEPDEHKQHVEPCKNYRPALLQVPPPPNQPPELAERTSAPTNLCLNWPSARPPSSLPPGQSVQAPSHRSQDSKSKSELAASLENLEDVIRDVAMQILLGAPKCQMTVGSMGNNADMAPLLQKMGPDRPKLSMLLRQRPETFSFFGDGPASRVVRLSQRALALSRQEQLDHIDTMNKKRAEEAWKEPEAKQASLRSNRPLQPPTRAKQRAPWALEDWNMEEECTQLLSMGFDRSVAMQALRTNRGDMIEALDQLSMQNVTAAVASRSLVAQQDEMRIEGHTRGGKTKADEDYILKKILEESEREERERQRCKSLEDEALQSALAESKQETGTISSDLEEVLEQSKRIEDERREKMRQQEEEEQNVLEQSKRMEDERRAKMKRQQEEEDEDMQRALSESKRLFELFHAVDDEEALLDSILFCSSAGDVQGSSSTSGPAFASTPSSPAFLQSETQEENDRDLAQLRAAIQASYNKFAAGETDDDDEEIVFEQHVMTDSQAHAAHAMGFQDVPPALMWLGGEEASMVDETTEVAGSDCEQRCADFDAPARRSYSEGLDAPGVQLVQAVSSLNEYHSNVASGSDRDHQCYDSQAPSRSSMDLDELPEFFQPAKTASSIDDCVQGRDSAEGRVGDESGLKCFFVKRHAELGVETDVDVLWEILSQLGDGELDDQQALNMWFGYAEDETLRTELLQLVRDYGQARCLLRHSGNGSV